MQTTVKPPLHWLHTLGTWSHQLQRNTPHHAAHPTTPGRQAVLSVTPSWTPSSCGCWTEKIAHCTLRICFFMFLFSLPLPSYSICVCVCGCVCLHWQPRGRHPSPIRCASFTPLCPVPHPGYKPQKKHVAFFMWPTRFRRGFGGLRVVRLALGGWVCCAVSGHQ